MIPRSEVRWVGNGGGGNSYGGAAPYCCTKCGRTMPAGQMMDGVDVCKRCRGGHKIKRARGKGKK